MGTEKRKAKVAKPPHGELSPEQRAARLRVIVAIGSATAVFVFILAGAVALKKAKKAGRLKADVGQGAQQDGVDKTIALGLGALLATGACWLIARHIVWLRAKSAQFYAQLEAERARAAAARVERAELQEQRRAQKASRGERASASPGYARADDLIDSMRAATATAWQWLRSTRAPLAPGAHIPSSAPVRPSKGPAKSAPKGGRGYFGSARRETAPRYGAARAETVSVTSSEMGAEAEEEQSEEENGGNEGEGGSEEEEPHEAVRVPLDLTPADEGTRIELSGLTASESLASVQPASLALALRCAACSKEYARAVTLSALDDRARECRVWCEGCATLFGATLRPTLLAPGSIGGGGGSGGALAHIDTVDCAVVDVLPSSELLCACLPCGAETVLKPLQRGRRAEVACHGCHVRLAFCAREIRLAQLTSQTGAAADGGGRRPRTAGRSGGDGAKAFDAELRSFRAAAARAGGVPTFRVGEPLPRNGACDHFKRSLRWLRFQCCGRALPCPICHEKSGCPAAELGVHAHVMICGLCSREQPFSNGKCECGAVFTNSFSAHWQGGAGCRDLARLSKKDAKKHHGAHKTVSNKANRVGARGRDARAAAA